VFGNFLPEDRQIAGQEAFSSRLLATFNALHARQKARKRPCVGDRLPPQRSGAYIASRGAKTDSAAFSTGVSTKKTNYTKSTGNNRYTKLTITRNCIYITTTTIITGWTAIPCTTANTANTANTVNTVNTANTANTAKTANTD